MKEIIIVHATIKLENTGEDHTFIVCFTSKEYADAWVNARPQITIIERTIHFLNPV